MAKPRVIRAFSHGIRLFGPMQTMILDSTVLLSDVPQRNDDILIAAAQQLSKYNTLLKLIVDNTKKFSIYIRRISRQINRQ